MAQVACCPQCSHDLLVPEESDHQSWAKCPECRAFFQLDQAVVRELPALLLVESPAPVAEPETFEPSSVPVDQPAEVSAAADEVTDAEPAQPQPAVGTQSTAERIDKWFRSAKTLADAPPIEPNKTLAELPDHFGTNTDFQLDESPAEPQSLAPWDDSHHMERLLADIETPPPDKPTENEPSAEPEQSAAPGETIPATSAAELPIFTKTTSGKPRRKRSLLRTLAVTMVAGVVGSALGYYALLWLRGPSGDFLNVAQYLPAAMLPAELQAQPPQSARVAPPIVEREDEEPAPAATNLAETPPESAEVQASYTTADEPPPAESQAAGARADDRYGLETTPAPPAEEPAPLEAPAADPATDIRPMAAAARVSNAPSFTADDLTAALQAAQEAQPSLVAGDFQDGRDVQRAKALGYSMLANLAEKASFVDGSNAESVAASQQTAEALFRQTLSDAHTRGEVAAILPKWISSPHRKHGGVFFAANLTRQQDAGSVVEYSGTIESGQSLTLLVPTAQADRLDNSARLLGIVGWIVEQPAEHVAGYTGQSPQAIWVSRLIPLE